MSMDKFTKEQIARASALAQELRSETNPQLTIEQNLENSIRMRIQDVDAKNVVTEINKGILSFRELYGKAAETDLANVIKEELDKLLLNMDEEQQRESLTNILRCCASATGQEIPTDQEYDLEVLREAVCIYFSEYSLVHMIGEDMLVEELDAEQIQKLLAASEEAYQEEYAAVAMYLLQVTGDVAQIPETLTPEEIGIMTAASIAAKNSYLQMILGKIDLEQIKRTLKLIAGITMLAILIAASWNVAKIAVAISMMCVGAALTKLGVTSKIITYLTGALTVSGIVEGVQKLGQNITRRSGLTQAVGAVFEKVKSYVTGSLVPAAKEFLKKLGAGEKKEHVLKTSTGLYQVAEDEEILQEEAAAKL